MHIYPHMYIYIERDIYIICMYICMYPYSITHPVSISFAYENRIVVCASRLQLQSAPAGPINFAKQIAIFCLWSFRRIFFRFFLNFFRPISNEPKTLICFLDTHHQAPFINTQATRSVTCNITHNNSKKIRHRVEESFALAKRISIQLIPFH